MEVIGHGVVVDLADRALLRAHAAREIAEVVDRQRHVGESRLADRLAIVPGLGGGERREIGLHPVGDGVEDVGALGGADAAPGGLRGVRRVQRGLDVVLVERAISQIIWPVVGEMLSK